MKELSIEEKAKRYDEAIEIINDYYQKTRYSSLSCASNDIEVLEKAFPELKESEDEKIRKALINGFKDYKGWDEEWFDGITVIEAIDWLEKQGEHAKFRNKIQIGDKVTRNEDGVLVNLSQLKRVAKKDEKQGEQKPAKNIVETWKEMRLEVYQQASGNRHEPNYSDDTTKMFSLNDIDEIIEKMSEQKPTCKVESKFHKGDWVIDKQSIVHQIANVIENVTNHTYGYDIVGGGYFNDNVEGVRLWTIQDAKDGDVLSWDDSKCITIFKNIYDKDSFNSYGFVGGCTGTFESRMSYHDIEGAHPATKEHRDTLIKAMADAGYAFDFEKKELKKIEQKSAWSEEDEKMLRGVITMCDIWSTKTSFYPKESNDIENLKNWLKSIKERVQPKQEWSEEDEDILNTIINHFKVDIECTDEDDIVRWLKSLKPQNTWKPSELQIEALESATENCAYSEYQDCLRELIGQLKKLREE